MKTFRKIKEKIAVCFFGANDKVFTIDSATRKAIEEHLEKKDIVKPRCETPANDMVFMKCHLARRYTFTPPELRAPDYISENEI